MIRAMLVSAMMMVAGCGMVRDPVVYSAEIQFSDLMVSRSAPSVRRFLTTACSCEATTVAWTATMEGVSAETCEANADWYRVWVSRWSWHLAMMRYNGGMEGATDPGAVPEVVMTCDLPESPAPLAPATSGGSS